MSISVVIVEQKKKNEEQKRIPKWSHYEMNNTDRRKYHEIFAS